MNFKVYKATNEDIDILHELILGLATYEKRPQDMKATKEDLSYWLFDKNIATALIAKLDNKPIGYAIYYPVFGSFSAKGNVHLEDIFLYEEYRGKGYGKRFLAEVIKDIFSNGYSNMEWSCLDWNTPSITFYDKIGAEQETGRVYFNFDKDNMQKLLNNIK